MPKRTFTVTCEWDAEAGVWYVAESDVPGLAGEAPTVDAMNAVLRERIPELIRANVPEANPYCEVPFDVLLKKSESVRLPC